MSTCPTGHYADDEGRVCVACTYPCLTCSGPGDAWNEDYNDH
jgi:hypothetical protein